jgi:lipopolysaccharide/colanic/teichoic acid biosynthesis glycosyltransferase
MVHDTLWPRRHKAVFEDLIGHVNFRLYLLAKRCMDFIVALIALLFLWPFMLVISAMIVVDSPGSPIFTQKRVSARWRSNGLIGYWETTHFNCHKFRTMAHKCDQSMHEAFIEAFVAGRMAASEEYGLPYKLSNDPRVTRIGHWLRKTSLDELPQLLNILKGEMSLVGPRPVPLYEAAAYRQWHRERLKALPGLTGMWQVKGRSFVTFDEMARLDIEYIRNQSISLDVKLLLATFPAVLAGKGAG